MKSTRVIIIHLLCWTIVLGYQYGGYLLNKQRFSSMALGISISLVQIVEFYICYLWVFPSYLKRKRTLLLIIGLIIALATFILLRYLIEEVFYLHIFGISNYASDTKVLDYISDNIYYGSSFIVVALAIFSAQKNFSDEVTNNRLKAESVKAELAFLRSQVNPHFLYNTLNYIYALAIPVSGHLADAVLRLSSLMRYTLSESPTGKVKLSKEVEYLESFIALFRMRFEPNFYVEFKQQGLKAEEEIAPLILIPFVENALKHGVINNRKCPIKISLSVSKQQLILEVANEISPAQRDDSSGVGLINIRRRLDLIYPHRHELYISNDGRYYNTKLIVDL